MYSLYLKCFFAAGKMYFILLGIILFFNFGITSAKDPPNIVVILTDDLLFKNFVFGDPKNLRKKRYSLEKSLIYGLFSTYS